MFDLAVVGGGIIGATVAFEAHARHPDWALAVVDPAPACGATCWSLGVSFPLAPTTGHRAMVRESLAWHAAWSGTPTPRQSLRMLFVVGSARRRTFLSAVDGAAFGPAPRELIEEAREAWSLQLGDDDEVLMGDDRVFRIDAPALARQLIVAAEAVTIESRVDALTVEEDASSLALDDGLSVAARRVVVATGSWYPSGLGKQLGVPSGVVVKRVSALECDVRRADAPAVYFVDDDLMIVPDDRGGRTLVSFYRRAWSDDPDVLTGALSSADAAEGTAALLRRSPSLAAAVVGGRSFCDAYAPERLPICMSAGPDVVAIVGGSGSGVRLAPALADLAMRQLDGGRLVETM
jgi:glycine/D-amino acid oxidase-like deaminating enzyme